MSFSLSEYTEIDVGWGFAPDPTGGAYSDPRPPSWFQGGRRGMKGRGEGRERGKLEGIASWLLGDRRPCIKL